MNANYSFTLRPEDEDRNSNLVGWLLANAGPVVRWRVASEFCKDFPSAELERLERDLLSFPTVQEWLGRLDLGEPGARLENLDRSALQHLGGMVHGSQPTCLENVLGRLAELGLRAGMPPVDLYLLAHLPTEMLDEQTAARVAAIVDYVLDPRFQSLQDGYGYAWIKARRTCYGWGWSPHLPGFRADGFAAGEGNTAALVQRLELMAHFPAARRSAWFQKALQHLESFRTGQGTYRFSATYLRDQPDGYYVSGYGMGLGEDRRKKIGLEIESTFRMLKIKDYVRTSSHE